MKRLFKLSLGAFENYVYIIGQIGGMGNVSSRKILFQKGRKISQKMSFRLTSEWFKMIKILSMYFLYDPLGTITNQSVSTLPYCIINWNEHVKLSSIVEPILHMKNTITSNRPHDADRGIEPKNF